MSIRIQEEPEIVITQAQHEAYYDEYQKSRQFYAGPSVSFETWLRGRLKQKEDYKRYDV